MLRKESTRPPPVESVGRASGAARVLPPSLQTTQTGDGALTLVGALFRLQAVADLNCEPPD